MQSRKAVIFRHIDELRNSSTDSFDGTLNINNKPVKIRSAFDKVEIMTRNRDTDVAMKSFK